MRDACVVGQLRGDDSVGIGWVGANRVDDVGVHKDVLPASSFVTTKKAIDILGDSDVNYLTMVHHRAKTIGDVTVAAAQPFHYVYGPTDARKDIVVAHNGTLVNYKLREDKLKFASDSDWLSWKLAGAHPNEDDSLDVARVLEDIDGAYSVVIGTSSHVYLANNGKRPMSVALTEDGTGLLFASEPAMLNWLLERNNIKTGTIYTLPAYKLYTIALDTKKIDMVESDIDDYSAHYGTTAMYPRSGYTTTTGGTASKKSMPEWYKEATGQEPVIFNKSPRTPTTNTVPTGATGDGISVTAVTELIGLTIACMFNELDAPKGQAYGIGWLSQEDMDELSPESRHVVHVGGVMCEATHILSVLDGNTVYVGKVNGVCTVQEMDNGKLVKKPYLMVDETTIREEAPGEGGDNVVPIGKYATV
jgi:hypothetical protein